MTQSVNIVIPVYNAFEEALKCIRSVLEYSPEAGEILIFDDASTEGDFAAYIQQQISNDTRLKIVRNQHNLGFVGTCNLGFEKSTNRDVVLLNSDTLVTPGWLKKMRAAAYSADRVATVTALSNNAVICSVPRFCLNNNIPADLELNEMAAVVEKVAICEYPELPTCMGFCVYIRRSALDRIGYFDAAAFGRGYGEENDFSQRAIQAGLSNICDDATFVFHKGSCSFLSLESELTSINGNVIKKRYPHYFDTISKFCRENPLRNIQRRIQLELLKRSPGQPRILHILHNGPQAHRYGPPGGTELHVQDLINNISNFQHFSLVKGRGVYYLSAHLKGVEREFILEASPGKLNEILSPDFFELLHLHHTRWFDYAELQLAMLRHGNYIVSTHDYSLICPQFYLYTLKKRACTGFECTNECGQSEQAMQALRAGSAELLNRARQTICFSDSTRENIARIVPNQANWLKIPHGINATVAARLPAAVSRTKFPAAKIKLAFLGYIPDHKGRRLVEKLQDIDELAGIRLEWHLFGKLFGRRGLRLIDHGEYQRNQLNKLLNYEQPDIVLLLSECPETYSLTLDEAWAAGIPVISTPLGAPAERVRVTGAGWVLDELSVDSILNCLRQILSNPEDYQDRCANISRVKLLTVEQQAAEYSRVYEQFTGASSGYALDRLLSHFVANELDSEPQPAGLIRLIGRLANQVIFALDTLKLRWVIQQAAYRLLPAAWLDRIKAAR